MPSEIVKLLARKDAVAVALFVVLVAVAAYLFDLHEQLNRLLQEFERWELDELLIVLFAFSVAMVWYSFRRLSEGRHLLEIQYNFIRAFEEAGEAIVIMDRSGMVEFSNRAYSAMTGYEPTGLEKQVFPLIAEHAEIWSMVQGGEPWQGMLDIRRKDGSIFPAMLSIAPICNAQEEVLHYVLIQKDMQEYQEMEVQLRQMQKMDALGALVGGVAHDFNNLLSGMMSNAFLAKSELPPSSRSAEYIRIIEKLVHAGADTVRQLLTFARKGGVQMEVLLLNEFIGELFTLVGKSVPENVNMKVHCVDEVLPVNADAVRLQQMMLNLINNANDAVQGVDAPEIRVDVASCRMDDSLKKRYPELQGEKIARIFVEDNGCGISEEHMDRLFEPFFTTKGAGAGTGIGLATVYGVVKAHQGAIEVDSHPGRGSRFSVYLPLTDRPADLRTSESRVVEGTGELILLADDDVHVRESLEKALRALNYKVLSVKDGVELVDTFKAHADQISLVITDIVMPGANGVDAMSEIRAAAPSMPVIFISGYDTGQALDKVEAWKEYRIHAKPVSVELISEQMKGLMSEAAIR